MIDDAQSFGFGLGFGGGLVLGFGAADAMKPVADTGRDNIRICFEIVV
jgi:hypothetical protein